MAKIKKDQIESNVFEDSLGVPSTDGYVLSSTIAGVRSWILGGGGGGGDVTKVGTPVDNQVGVWTGDGTIKGDTSLTYDGSTLKATGLQLSGVTNQIKKFAHIQLTQAQIQALNTTPIEIVAAPGAGKYIEVRGASAFLNHNGTDYAASNALTLETGSIYVSSTTSNSFIPSSADRIEEFKKVTTATATFNVPLKVRGSGNATGNGGTIDIFLEYVIIDTN